MTAKAEILRVLAASPRPLAVHEFNITNFNQNNLATRASELAKDGKIAGRYRPGKPFKEWFIPKPGQQDLPMEIR